MLQPRSLSVARSLRCLRRLPSERSTSTRLQSSQAASRTPDPSEIQGPSPRETKDSESSNELNSIGSKAAFTNASSIMPNIKSDVSYEAQIQDIARIQRAERRKGFYQGARVNTLVKRLREHARPAFEALDSMLADGKHPSKDILEDLMSIACNSQHHSQALRIQKMYQQYWIPMPATTIELFSLHLSHIGDFTGCRNFLDGQVQAGRTVSPKAWTNLLTAIFRARQSKLGLESIKHVVATLSRGHPPATLSDVVYYDALVAFADNYDMEGVQWVWDRVVRKRQIDSIDAGACTKVLNACGRNGLPILATDVMKFMARQGTVPVSYHYAALIESYCVAGDVKNAFIILDIMRKEGIEPTKTSAAAIVSFLSTDLDLVDRAFFTLQDLHAAGGTVDVAAFNAVIDASVLRRDVSRAVATYQEHKALGVTPDVNTLNSLILGCVGAYRKDLALSMVALFDKEHGIVANAETFAGLIGVSVLQEDYEDAFKFLEEMKEEGHQPSADTYSLIFRRCIVANDPRAKVAYEEMKGWGIRHAGVENLLRPDGQARSPIITDASTGLFDRLLTMSESQKWFKHRTAAPPAQAAPTDEEQVEEEKKREQTA